MYGMTNDQDHPHLTPYKNTAAANSMNDHNHKETRDAASVSRVLVILQHDDNSCHQKTTISTMMREVRDKAREEMDRGHNGSSSGLKTLRISRQVSFFLKKEVLLLILFLLIDFVCSRRTTILAPTTIR
jgi:hypothetical protein